MVSPQIRPPNRTPNPAASVASMLPPDTTNGTGIGLPIKPDPSDTTPGLIGIYGSPPDATLCPNPLEGSDPNPLEGSGVSIP